MKVGSTDMNATMSYDGRDMTVRWNLSAVIKAVIVIAHHGFVGD